MKKLIGLFALLFITTGVFGQMFIRDLSFIRVREGFVNGKSGPATIEENIRRYYITEDFDWIEVVHFVKGNKLFLLSYEPEEDLNNPEARSIYLYSKDVRDVNNPWEKASGVVMTNNWNGIRNHDEVDFYIYDEKRHNTSIGEVIIVDDNCVMITIRWEMWVNGGLSIKKPMTFIFTDDNGDGFYSIRDGNSSSL